MIHKLLIGFCLFFSLPAFAELLCTTEEKGCSLRIFEASATLNCAGIPEIQFTSCYDEGTRLRGEITNEKGPIKFIVYEPERGFMPDSLLVSHGYLNLFGGEAFLIKCQGKLSDRIKATPMNPNIASDIDQLRDDLNEAPGKNRPVLDLFDETVCPCLSQKIFKIRCAKNS
jgi:hypothetical protein